MTKKISVEHFDNEFENVLKRIKPLNKKYGFPMPFKPISGKLYKSAKLKIAYIGLETKGWENNDCFLNCKESFKDNLGGFWDLVLNLHLKIKKMDNDIKKALDNNFDDLNDFVWGNLNVLENLEAIKKRVKINDECIFSEYKKIKLESEPLNKLKFLLHMYKPDFVFILSWQGDDEKYFENLGFNLINENENEKIYSYCVNYNNRKTNVVWTCHPSYARRQGISVESFSKKLYSEFNKLNSN